MIEKKIEANYLIYESIDEMSIEDRDLIHVAIKQLDTAYAPYSQFRVGAAVRLSDDSIYPGSNQENASYPLCICAERVALYVGAMYKPAVPPSVIAITIKNERMTIDGPVSPCGACRQVIAEFESRHQQPIRILLKSDGPQIYEIKTIKDLLPLGFDQSFL